MWAKVTFTSLVAPDSRSLHSLTPPPHCPCKQAHRAPPTFPLWRETFLELGAKDCGSQGRDGKCSHTQSPGKDSLSLLGRNRSQHHLWRCSKPSLSHLVPGKGKLLRVYSGKPTTNLALAIRASSLHRGWAVEEQDNLPVTHIKQRSTAASVLTQNRGQLPVRGEKGTLYCPKFSIDTSQTKTGCHIREHECWIKAHSSNPGTQDLAQWDWRREWRVPTSPSYLASHKITNNWQGTTWEG